MVKFVFFMAIVFLSACAAYITIKSIFQQFKVRRAITRNKRLLSNMRDKKIEGKYHTYNNLLQYSLLNLRGKFKNTPQRELESMIDKEITRLAQNPFKRFYNNIIIFLKVGSSFLLIIACLIFSFTALDQYQVMQVTAEVAPSNKSENASDSTESAQEKKQAESVQKKEKELKKQAAKEQKEKEAAAEALAKQNKEQVLYEGAIALSESGQLELAVKELEKIKEKSKYYEQSRKSIKKIKEDLYWSNVLYPSYTEITKSPQNFEGKTVGFSGAINDIIESDGKTLIIVGTEYLGDYYNEHASDILVLYPKTTKYMEGDFINIAGTMKGNFVMTEQDYLVGSYFNTPVSFSTSAYTDQNQMPVIIADFLY